MRGKSFKRRKQPQQIQFQEETIQFVSEETLKPTRRWTETQNHGEDGKRAEYFRKVAKEDCEREFRTKTIQNSTTTATRKYLQAKTAWTERRKCLGGEKAVCYRQNLRLARWEVFFSSWGCGQLPKWKCLHNINRQHSRKCQNTFQAIETNWYHSLKYMLPWLSAMFRMCYIFI